MVPNLVFSLNLVCPTLGQTRSGEKTTLGPFSAEVVQPLSSDPTGLDRGYTNSAEWAPNLVFSLNLVCPTLGQTRSGEKTRSKSISAVSALDRGNHPYH